MHGISVQVQLAADDTKLELFGRDQLPCLIKCQFSVGFLDRNQVWR